MRNKITYRVGLGGFVLAFLMMPWIGYKNWDNGDGGISSGKAWLWAELIYTVGQDGRSCYWLNQRAASGTRLRPFDSLRECKY